MRKNRESILDEMQELELLKIERTGCWMAFWLLLIAMAVQMIAYGNADYKTIAGEWIVFMILAIYMAVACIRRGIWDRKLAMDSKTNLLISLAAGVIFGALEGIVIYKNYHMAAIAAATAVISAVIVFAACMLGLSVAMNRTKKRIEKMEEEPEDADEM